MQMLKTLVIVMGILIVAGLSVIGVTIFNRYGSDAEKDDIAMSSYGVRSVSLPPGSYVENVTASDNRVVVWARTPRGWSYIIVLDPESGEEIGVFEFEDSR